MRDEARSAAVTEHTWAAVVDRTLSLVGEEVAV
jgi:hypothetical protein